MKKILATFVLATVSAVAPPSSLSAPDLIEKNKAVTRRVFEEILSQGKYEVYSEIYGMDFVGHAGARNFTLTEDIEAAKADRAACSDLAVTVEQMVGEDDKVAIFWTSRGTHDGAWKDIPPSGKKIKVSGMTIYRLAEGRIVEEWTTWNLLSALNQVGLFRSLFYMTVPGMSRLYGHFLELLAGIVILAVIVIYLLRRRRARALHSGQLS